jgi:hypothetical protein
LHHWRVAGKFRELNVQPADSRTVLPVAEENQISFFLKML